MKTSILAGLILTAVAALAAAPAPASAAPLQGAARTEALAQANAALNELRQVKGRFVQVAPDGGVSEGQFYLQRPGRVRFAFEGAAPLTIVADGATVAVADARLKTVDRTPLRATPLFFVLKSDINLERDARIAGVDRDGEALTVTLRDRKGEADGALSLLFVGGAEPELRGWRVTDATGQVTQVSLKDLAATAKLDPGLFVLEDPNDSAGRRRGR